MPACGTADHADLLRVDVQLPGVSPQPADRGLAVVNLFRPSRLTGEPVVQGCSGERAILDEYLQHADEGIALVPVGPAAAMDGDDERSGLAGLFPGQKQIKRLLRVAGFGVRHIAPHLDILRQRRHLAFAGGSDGGQNHSQEGTVRIKFPKTLTKPGGVHFYCHSISLSELAFVHLVSSPLGVNTKCPSLLSVTVTGR